MSTINTAQFDQVISNLPALPQVVQRAITAIDSDDVGPSDVAEILAQDPVIATRLLRLANSPFYGMSGKISSIQQACVVLGMQYYS